MPSAYPTIIAPPGGLKPQPANTTLIQLGFNNSLNYDFVATHQTSSSQIFQFVPEGIAYGLDCDATQNVTMHALQAYDTRASLGYVTTLALAYIPQSQVGTLSLEVRTAVSKLYSNPEASVNALMSMINPSIPIEAGNIQQNGGNGVGGVGNNGQGGSGNLGSSSGPVRGTSVGIGVGVVGGAAVYGAAMFYVARRYKKRKQGHARSPSVNDGNLSPGTDYSAMMSGGAQGFGERPVSNVSGSSHGRSFATRHARQAGISRPINAENSLGWR